ncbi:PAS domain S-box protein [Rhodospirillum sp. A1_3_36]|uniref:sensor histidine kinase n=1 Tax=Rhodospirillum sp. A1_3_36 TaxID=3391666 RepID=UPI0039A522A8
MTRGVLTLRRSIYLAPTVAGVIFLLLIAVFLQALNRERRTWEGAWEAREQLTREVNVQFDRFTLGHSNFLFGISQVREGLRAEVILGPEEEHLAWVRSIRADVLALDARVAKGEGVFENRELEGLFNWTLVALEKYEVQARRTVGDASLGGAKLGAELKETIRGFHLTHKAFTTLRSRLESSVLDSTMGAISEGQQQSFIVWGLALALVPVMFLLARWVAQDVTGSLVRTIDRLRSLGAEAHRDLSGSPEDGGEGKGLPLESVSQEGRAPGKERQETYDPFSLLWESVDAFEQVLQELRTSRRILRHHLRELALQTEGRVAAEAAFGVSEHRFQTLVDNANVAIFVHRRGEMLYANPALCSLIGATQMGVDIHEIATDRLVESEARGKIWECHEACLRGESAPTDFEMVLVRLDAARLVVINRSFLIEWEDGPAVCTTLLDHTERREALDRLRILSAAIDQTPNMFFITDTSGRIEYINPAFTELTGYSAEEALGEKPSLLRHPSTSPETYKDLWRTIRSGREWRAEIVDRRKDGSYFWAFTSICPVRDGQGHITHYVAMHQDVTPQKTADLALRQAMEEAEVANRAKTDLLANMSHELRTPLNAIIGFSETMLGQFLGPMDQIYLEYAKDIRDSGAHLLSLINDILDVSAIEAGHMPLREEVTDLAEVMDSVQRLIRPRAELAGLTLQIDPLPVSLNLWCDGRRLKQILLNLLSNAAKFTEEGGRISLMTTVGADGGVRMVVRDTGIGMDSHGIETALSPFGQVDSGLGRRHQGSGLGLPLTQGLVSLHGGRLTLESEPGQGTTVTVVFPPERTWVHTA